MCVCEVSLLAVDDLERKICWEVRAVCTLTHTYGWIDGWMDALCVFVWMDGCSWWKPSPLQRSASHTTHTHTHPLHSFGNQWCVSSCVCVCQITGRISTVKVDRITENNSCLVTWSCEFAADVKPDLLKFTQKSLKVRPSAATTTHAPTLVPRVCAGGPGGDEGQDEVDDADTHKHTNRPPPRPLGIFVADACTSAVCLCVGGRADECVCVACGRAACRLPDGGSVVLKGGIYLCLSD